MHEVRGCFRKHVRKPKSQREKLNFQRLKKVIKKSQSNNHKLSKHIKNGSIGFPRQQNCFPYCSACRRDSQTFVSRQHHHQNTCQENIKRNELGCSKSKEQYQSLLWSQTMTQILLKMRSRKKFHRNTNGSKHPFSVGFERKEAITVREEREMVRQTFAERKCSIFIGFWQ